DYYCQSYDSSLSAVF
nr:immunoglobulin light chain junction region [Macaca mulatta]MOX16757.1 immunoglobulin light chain junction region [Macaca mulatta]MOX16783.1 immunoglobulin light chain junction region [Macaca mulatta]MOX16820.1 immunoglobulin light chain junction region [Macaca mulatta]MOX16837.1 immunoglobulin light chain junction region [Macaca mulatta]